MIIEVLFECLKFALFATFLALFLKCNTNIALINHFGDKDDKFVL